LLQLASILAGLPSTLRDDPQSLKVYVNQESKVVLPNQAPLQSFIPMPFVPTGEGEATASVTRQYYISAFASLPDHSYALWDWISGNETCPDGTTSQLTIELAAATGKSVEQLCHTFSTHLGMVNSTHFLPQLKETYFYYHDLALLRAKECKALATQLTASALYNSRKSELDTYVQECERQALLIEAVGQHFLQDAWAIGHMWHRWGYPTLDQFKGDSAVERHLRAFMVSAIAGVVHGAESMVPLPDLMSAGHNPLVSWRPFGISCGNAPQKPCPQGIGDVHAKDLLGFSKYNPQSAQLLNCSASGLREVYEATAMLSGPASATSSSANVTSGACFGQRATNEAIYAGFGVNVCQPDDPTDIVDCFIPLDKVLSVAQFGIAQLPSVVPVLSNAFDPYKEKFQDEYAELTKWVKKRAAEAPHQTDLAEHALLPPELRDVGLFGVQQNKFGLALPEGQTHPVKLPSASYADPALPWPPNASDPTQQASAQRARWLARAFHKAHVREWCSDPETDPSALKASVRDSTTNNTSVRKEICTEFVKRQIRIDASPSVCDVLGVDDYSVAALTNAPSDATQAARQWCTEAELAIVVDGPGSVAYSSTDGNSGTCTTTCTKAFQLKSQVTLTAVANAGAKFWTWTSPCAFPKQCSLVINEDRSITAQFEKETYDLTLKIAGSGTLKYSGPSESGISGECGAPQCLVANIPAGTFVALTAQPTSGSKVTGWSGACESYGAGSDCSVKMDSDKEAGVTFGGPQEYTITLKKVGLTTYGSIYWELGTTTNWQGSCHQEECKFVIQDLTGEGVTLSIVGGVTSTEPLNADNISFGFFGYADTCSPVQPNGVCTTIVTSDRTFSVEFGYGNVEISFASCNFVDVADGDPNRIVDFTISGSASGGIGHHVRPYTSPFASPFTTWSCDGWGADCVRQGGEPVNTNFIFRHDNLPSYYPIGTPAYGVASVYYLSVETVKSQNYVVPCE